MNNVLIQQDPYLDLVFYMFLYIQKSLDNHSQSAILRG